MERQGAAHTRSAQIINTDAGFFENLEDTQVGEAASGARAKGNADFSSRQPPCDPVQRWRRPSVVFPWAVSQEGFLHLGQLELKGPSSAALLVIE
jgi:hypothetical protein